MNTPIPVAVIGCGRMGRLHARCWSQIPQVKLVGVCDALEKSAKETAALYNTAAFTNPADLLDKVFALSIATPTEHHLAVAKPFIERGVACLIEKPLAKTSAECAKIAELADKHRAIVQVGHIERFNPAVVALRKLNLTPICLETIRISPMSFRSMDVGVTMDMMIHDIDIVLSLINSKPVKAESSGLAIFSDADDACSARVTFENGAVANLTASRIATSTERKLRFYAREAIVHVDYAKKSATLFRADENVARLREIADSIKSGKIDPATAKYDQLVKSSELPIDNVEQIRAQLDAFLDAVLGKSPCQIPAEAGHANVQLAEMIVAAMKPKIMP